MTPLDNSVEDDEVHRADDALGTALQGKDLLSLVVAGLSWQRAKAKAMDQAAQRAKLEAARSDRQRTILTLIAVLVLAVACAVSLVFKMPDTVVVADVTATSANLVLKDDWQRAQAVAVEGVTVTQVSILSISGTKPLNYPTGASVQIDGGVVVSSIKVRAATGLTIAREETAISLALVAPVASASSPVATVRITVQDKPVTVAVSADNTTTPMSLPPGTTLTLIVANTPAAASITLTKPNDMNLSFPAQALDFIDQQKEVTVTGGTLTVPTIGKSIPLHGHDRLNPGAATVIEDCNWLKQNVRGCVLVDYTAKDGLAFSIRYKGDEFGIGGEYNAWNIIPTAFEWGLNRWPLLSPLTTILGLLVGLGLWALGARVLIRR